MNKITLIIEIIILNISSVWWYTERDFEPLIVMIGTTGTILFTLFSGEIPVLSPKKMTFVITLNIISILILIAGVVFSDDKSPSIKITSLKQSERVEEKINIEGIAKNLEPDQQIWIIVHDLEAGKYFPHNDAALFLDNNKLEWENKSTGIGTPIDVGNKFDIYAIAFRENDNFSNSIENYLSNPARQGMGKRPPFEIFDKVTVLRK